MTFQYSIKAVMVSVSLLFMHGCSQHELKELNQPLLNTAKAHVVATGLNKAPVHVGDVFVYDNPVVHWEVINTSNETIEWRDRQNGYMKTTLSTLIPKLRWSSNGDAGSRRIEVISGFLHPLKKGNKITFIENTVRARPGSTFVAKWVCEVQEQIEIVVTAGKSMTWPVLCSVNDIERVLFNYAENIGNVVRYIVVKDDGSQYVRQLTNYVQGATSSD